MVGTVSLKVCKAGTMVDVSTFGGSGATGLKLCRAGAWGALGAVVSIVPNAPTMLMAGSRTSTEISFVWMSPVANGAVIVRYALRRSLDAGTTWDTELCYRSFPAGGVTWFGLLPGTTYVFAVRAETASGVGPWSDPTGPESTLTPADTTAPGPVTGLNANGGIADTGHTLDWTNPTDSDLAGVMIRRNIGSVAPANITQGTFLSSALTNGVMASGLSPGTTYSYSLFAFDEVPNYSPPTSLTVTTTGTPPDTTAPSPIIGLTAGEGPGGTWLEWNCPADSDFTGVMIRRNIGAVPPISIADGTFVYSTSALGPNGHNAYSLWDLDPAITYSYSVFACDEVPNYSAPASVTFTPTWLPPINTNPFSMVGVIATASTFLTSEWAPIYALDNIPPDWNTPGDDAWAASGIIDWLQGQFPSQQFTSGYKITARNLQGVTQAPRDWTFLGSNDGTAWTTLDTRTGESFGAEQEKSYTFTRSSIAYAYYRISVSANNGGSVTAIAQLTITNT